MDGCTIDVDETRGGVDKPCYTLEEGACTREAPHKPTKHAQEQEREGEAKNRNFMHEAPYFYSSSLIHMLFGQVDHLTGY